MTKTIALLLVLMLPACSLVPSQREVEPTAARTFTISKPADAADESRTIDRALQATLNFCLPRLRGYEAKSQQQAETAFWLQVSGMVAGAVLAPMIAAGGGSLALLAGLSGYAGAIPATAQILRTSGLSGSSIADTRNQIIRSLKEEINIASDGSKPFDVRAGAIMRARTECVVYEIAVPSAMETSQ